MSFDHPEVAGATGTTDPVDVDEVQDITFTVDLVNGADSASLQMSQVTWLGEVA